MRFFSPYTIIFLVFSSSSAVPPRKPDMNAKNRFLTYDYGHLEREIKTRQSSAIYVTSGVHTGQAPGGGIPRRQEIRDLQKDPIMWNLYILGLDRLQNSNQSDMVSWYNVAGIHGRPFESFDGVKAEPGNEESGYCLHVSVLFPTWHRPYVALFEQVLHSFIQGIAYQYPRGAVRDKYVAAAANFRVPYWDWAAQRSDGDILPLNIVGNPGVNVDGPYGTQLIANPLYSYRFQPLNSHDLPNNPFNRYHETIRDPNTYDDKAVSNDNFVAARLANSSAGIQSRLYTLFSNYRDYVAFSNEGYRNTLGASQQDSLESLHDQIHGITGSGGHMSYTDYAAFDPIFMLHHAMVDRIFAMWQVLYPNAYVKPEYANYNTFTTVAGEIQDINSPLTPFFKDDRGNFWTSADVRGTEVFGYTYAETANVTGVNTVRTTVTAINRLYSPGRMVSGKRDGIDAYSMSAVGAYREWVANIRVRKHALNAPYVIYIFMGPFNPDPSHWYSDPALIGSHTTFEKTVVPGGDEFAGYDLSQMVSAAVPLTQGLMKRIIVGELKSLEEVDVMTWLPGQFSYRISYLNNTAIPNYEVPSLKISIASAEVRMPDFDWELPVWGEMKNHIELKMGEWSWLGWGSGRG